MGEIQLKWYTIPAFSQIEPVSLYGKEYEKKTEKTCCDIQNLHVLARAKVYYEERHGAMFLKITADDYYKLYINGEYAGQGPAPAYPESYYYNKIDITHFLKNGINVLAVHLYYQGLVNRVWNSGDGRFGVAAQIEDKGGRREDLKWKFKVTEAYSGDIIGYDTQFLENFDSNKWDVDWNACTFDDSKWKEMVPVSNPDYRLFLQPVKMLDVYIKEPQYIEKSENGCFLDMGGEITGALRVYASGSQGSRITILCGEECLEDGDVRWEMRCGLKYQEVWTLKEGQNILEPYDYKGFRFARLITEGKVAIEKVEAVVRHYPMEKVCSLQCSSQYVEDIFRICKNAVKYGTQEGYLDCPTREKGQYLGDAVVTALSQVWLTGTVEMLRKCICQFAQTTCICSGLMAVAPGSYMQEIADFSLLWPQLLLTDYNFTGDQSFLREYYTIAKGILEYFSKYKRQDGMLVCVSEKWNLVDWPENLRDGYDMKLNRPLTSCVCHNVINALYAGAVKTLNRIEEILGICKSYDFEQLKDSYIKVFYDTEKQLFTDSEISRHAALHSNIYALYFGLCPSESKEKIADFLIQKGLSCGVLMSYFYLKALAGVGKFEAVYQTLVNDSNHGWVNMLREGATTCYEAWGKDQKWNTSLCHPWASAPIPILIEDIAGFKPTYELEKGYSFHPHIPEELEEFTLELLFRGQNYRIEKMDGNIKLIQKEGEECEE